MDRPVRVLFVEDSPIDVELECRELRRENLDFTWRVVASEAELSREMREFQPDVVLSDFSMPGFSGLSALHFLRHDFPRTPLIFVSGTIGEELAVRCLREGATDYILKGHLARLGSAVRRAIEHVHQQEKMLASEQARERLVEIIEATPDIVATTDPDGRITYLNDAGCRLLGVTRDEIIGQPAKAYYSEQTVPIISREAMPEALCEGVWQGEVSLKSRGGTEIPVSQVVIAHKGGAGEPRFLSGIARDMRERKTIEAQLYHLAHHDSVTGLPNRSMLGDRVTQALVHARRSGRSAVLMQVHVENFNLLADGFGHTAADRVIDQIGRRLREAVRDGDTIARTGAEDFAVLLADLARADDAGVVARKILDALGRPLREGDHEMRITASIGAAAHPADGEDFESLLRNAGAAVRRTSAQERGGFQFYTAEMTRESVQRIAIEAGLQAALEHRELSLYFQPQYEVGGRRIVGVEALMRWFTREGTSISPASFIPVAEECGLIRPMGEWALLEACTTALGWVKPGGTPVRVAVNVSPRQLGGDDFSKAVARVLEATGFPPHCLELEITEGALLGGGGAPPSALNRLKALGVMIAIDDFGTGYSSLSYLSRLPIDRLKVDRSFVRRMGDDSRDAAIVQTIVALSHGLGLGVVAEGVESRDQLEMLAGMGCDEVQGFLLGQPLPAARMGEVLGVGVPA